MTITGTIATLNNALSLLYWQPYSTASVSQPNVIDVMISDQGNTAGLAKTATLQIALTPNSTATAAPTVTGPGNQTGPTTPLASPSPRPNGNALHVADGNSAGASETVYVQVLYGSLIASNSGSSIGSSLLALTGTIAQLNADLDGLHYTSTQNGAADPLDITIFANGLSNSLELNIAFQNSSTLTPILTAPGPQSVAAAAVLSFTEATGNAFHVAAGDANGVTEQVEIQVLSGRLAVGNTAGLTSVTGNGTSTLVLMGDIASLNAALDGLEYAPAPGIHADFLSLAFGNNGSCRRPDALRQCRHANRRAPRLSRLPMARVSWRQWKGIAGGTGIEIQQRLLARRLCVGGARLRTYSFAAYSVISE